MKVNAGVFAVLLMSAVITGSYSGQALSQDSVKEDPVAGEKQDAFEDLDDRFSYAYGYDLAEKFRAEGLKLNASLMAEAMQDVFEDREKKMSAGEVAATLEIYQKIHARKKEEERAVIAEKNRKEGEAFLAENAEKEGVIVTDSGLQYRVIAEGNGGYKPTENDEVTVHYRGTFVDGTEFDSTYQRNEPYSVRVKQLIDGWAEALQMMSEGARWELYIPAEIAYGEQGAGEYVGPNAALIFEVELLEINKDKG